MKEVYVLITMLDDSQSVDVFSDIESARLAFDATSLENDLYTRLGEDFAYKGENYAEIVTTILKGGA